MSIPSRNTHQPVPAPPAVKAVVLVAAILATLTAFLLSLKSGSGVLQGAAFTLFALTVVIALVSLFAKDA